MQDLGKDNTDVKHLDLNYRSLKNIVDFNRILIDKVVDIDNQYLNNLIDNALQNKRISQSTHTLLYDIVKHAYVDNRQTAFIKSDENGIAEVCLFDKVLVKESPFIEALEDAISRGYRTAPYPAPVFLRAFRERGFGAIITSDCHNATHLACHFDEAEELLRANGFTERYILTKGGFEAISL